MSELCALAYVSSAVRRMSDAELEALLRGARRFNAGADVSGVLLYHDGSFFQYLEGPPAAVAAAYDRVHVSPLHRGIFELLHAAAPQRHFHGWHMGFSQPGASLMLALSHADWVSAQRRIGPPSNGGVQLLLDFWQRSQGGA